ncbi:MAG TPA: radical SAM/SPASM domain-containing protein, partial [Methylomirabilota bacterium]
GQCNLRCQMCPILYREDGPPYGPPAFMAFETFTALLEQFVGVEELQLQGLGEPMMHPRFFDMVAHAAARGITVSTNSNMTLLPPARAERCVRSGLERLHVSIDSARAETFERIRKRARLDRVLGNVRGLLEARDRLGRATPRLSLVTVLMRQNLDELPRLVELAASLRVEAMFVQHLAHDFGEDSVPERYRPMRGFVESQTLLHEDPERIAACFAAARDAAAAHGVTLRLPRVRPRAHASGTPGPARCDWPWRGAYVSYQGLAMPCCMVATPDRINFGDMARDGVRSVWHGAGYADFRRRLDSEEPPAVCRSCSVYRGTF